MYILKAFRKETIIMKSTKIVALVLVAAMLCLALASCGKKLSGKYEAGGDLAGVSYTFNGSKVTITYKVLGVAKSFEGKYKIDGDTITFTFDDKDNVDSKYTGSKTFSEGKDDNGNKFVKIGGVTYTKAK